MIGVVEERPKEQRQRNEEAQREWRRRAQTAKREQDEDEPERQAPDDAPVRQRPRKHGIDQAAGRTAQRTQENDGHSPTKGERWRDVRGMCDGSHGDAAADPENRKAERDT
jgi:hypothetical protein